MLENRQYYKDKGKELNITEIPAKDIPLDEEPVIDKRPVVLFAAIYSPWFNSDGMVHGFEEAGYRVELFDWQRIRYDNGLPIADRLIAKAQMVKPDLIFLHLQVDDIIDATTAKILSSFGFVVNYTLDVRKDISWYEAIAPYIGLTVFADKNSAEQLRKQEIMNVANMHSSADFDWYKPLRLTSKQDYGEVVFIGNNYSRSAVEFDNKEERVAMVNFLRSTYGERFRVYGSGWGGDTRTVTPQEEILIYNSAKVAITHNHFNRVGYTSDRIWRSTGCECATISQWYNGINQDFNATNIGVWLNFEMLKESVDKFLKDDEFRKAVATNGGLNVRMNHSWAKRFEYLNELIKSATNDPSAEKLRKV